MSAAESIRARARDVVAHYQGNPDDAPLLVRAIESALQAAIEDERAACLAIANEEANRPGSGDAVAIAAERIRARGK